MVAHRYIVITPARNEEENIVQTIRSMAGQTLKPVRWCIVDDGSTDRTSEIVKAAAIEHAWIIAVNRADRGFRKQGGGVIDAFYDGFEKIDPEPWDFLVKLDSDLSFDRDYFERCLEKFDEEPSLGIGGGLICNEVESRLECESPGDPAFHVRGATKIYRRRCWEAIGGLIHAPGWDGVDELKANMLGWKTLTFTDITIRHHRLTGSMDGAWRNQVKFGLANYITGYHPLFMLAKCVKRAFSEPYFVGSIALAWGYVSGYLYSVRRVDDADLMHYVREQQLRKLTFRTSVWSLKKVEKPTSNSSAITSRGEEGSRQMAPQVSIIIVNWNSVEFLKRCLQSTFESVQGVTFEIVVVDGASFDGCDEMLEREFPMVKFIQCEHNIGFARANNLGVRHSEGRNLLFLNPDTELLGNSLGVLMKKLECLPHAGAVGCKLLNSDGSLQTSCIQSFPTVLNQLLDANVLRNLFPLSKLWGMSALFAEGKRAGEVEVICGACVLVKREVFEKIGGFSENYFMYGEDLDLCYKIKKAGLKVYYTPETSVVHHGGGSTRKSVSNFSNVMMCESVFRFMRFNRSMISAVFYRVGMGTMAIARVMFLFSFEIFSGNRVFARGSRSLHKWQAIFRWSFGLKSWNRNLSVHSASI